MIDPMGSFSRRQFLGASIAGAGAALSGIACRPRVAAALIVEPCRVVRRAPGVASTDGAGVHLTRLLGHAQLRHLDPFVLLDRIRSHDPRDYEAGFPDHPHRGFETVSIMLDGHMLHRDSRGNHGDIVGGGAQWMTAGSGIVHSEMPRQATGLLSGFQLWVNLPAREKWRKPEYQDLAPSRLSHATLSPAGSALAIIAGEVDGLRGPVEARATAPLLLTATLEDDRPLSLPIPRGHQAVVYVSDGLVEIGGTPTPSNQLCVLSSGNRLTLRAPSERSAVLVAAGRPLGEPIVQRGPFVMNTEAEIRQAFDDYRAGRLG